jgi:hypothetical protein
MNSLMIGYNREGNFGLCNKDTFKAGLPSDCFSSSLCIQTSSEAQPTNQPTNLPPNGYRRSFPENETRTGHDADHSPPSSAEVKNK